MPSGTSRWALASTSTSLALALALAAGAPAVGADSGQAAPADELDLARRGAIYLLIDVETRRLEVKARGMALESFVLSNLELQLFESRDPAQPPALPAVWIVEVAPEAEHRRRQTPQALRPYQADDSEVDDAAALTPQPASSADEPATPEPPTSYRVDLENGWELALGQKLPRLGLGSRAGLALSSAWARIGGRVLDPPHVLAITLEPAAARKLHHLFQPGFAVLVR